MLDNNVKNKKGSSKKILNHITAAATNCDVPRGALQEYESIGRRISGQTVTKSCTNSIMSDFMNDVITQVNPNHKNEQINWTKIQRCQTDKIGHESIIAIIIGLMRGYQIYVMENDVFEEVVSVRKVPLKIGHLLPFTVGGEDNLSMHRPILATTYEDSSSGNILNFLSLKSGKIFLKFNFDGPILDIDSSFSVLLVASVGTIIIYSHGDLSESSRIKVPNNSPIYSLSVNLLALVNDKLDRNLQSCGLVDDEYLLTNNQVITTAKTITKTMSSIGESLVSTLSTPTSRPNNAVHTSKKAGIVTIVNTEKPKTKNKINLNVLTHFCAHNDASIGHLMFGKGGQMLMTGSSSSTIFNVFLLHFHPKSSSLSVFQHIYTLVRGNSVAKVIGSTFSLDNRWIAISTNHGTTHLFTINPYGGLVTARTHRGKLMNKESRFEKTAGVKSPIYYQTNKTSVAPKASPLRTHPGTRNSTILRMVTNAYAANFNAKCIPMHSALLAKQRIFSSENLRAWASDNTPTILNAASNDNRLNQNGTHCKEMALKRSVLFLNGRNVRQHNDMAVSLLMLEGDGILTQYRISVSDAQDQQTKMGIRASIVENERAEQTQANVDVTTSCLKPTSATTTHNKAVAVKNDCLEAKLTQAVHWELTRNKGTVDLEVVNPPLQANNALMRICTKANKHEEAQKKASQSWLPFLEVTTYMGPHRRLWLGPQFSFNVHSSAEKNNSQKIDQGKCCPVLIEREMADVVTAPEAVERIVCGSWSSEFDFKTSNNSGAAGMGLVKEKIDEAMREANVNEQEPELLRQEDLMTLSGIDF